MNITCDGQNGKDYMEDNLDAYALLCRLNDVDIVLEIGHFWVSVCLCIVQPGSNR